MNDDFNSQITLSASLHIHQRFTPAFFVRKSFRQLISSYVLAKKTLLYIKKRAKNVGEIDGLSKGPIYNQVRSNESKVVFVTFAKPVKVGYDDIVK